jgi:uncharacterized membrane protein
MVITFAITAGTVLMMTLILSNFTTAFTQEYEKKSSAPSSLSAIGIILRITVIAVVGRIY